MSTNIIITLMNIKLLSFLEGGQNMKCNKNKCECVCVLRVCVCVGGGGGGGGGVFVKVILNDGLSLLVAQ